MSIANARARILTSPYSCWVAAPGTAFPTLTTAESAFASTWTKVGESGDKNYSEAGVTVTHSETVATFQSAGSTVPRKAWRTDEGLEVAFELADLSPEQYALILDNATVTHVTGSPGERKFELYRGPVVHYYAVLLRGPSAEEETLEAQYEIPFAYQAANQAPKLALKGGPAMLAVQFTALEVEAGKFGTLKMGTPT